MVGGICVERLATVRKVNLNRSQGGIVSVARDLGVLVSRGDHQTAACRVVGSLDTMGHDRRAGAGAARLNWERMICWVWRDGRRVIAWIGRAGEIAVSVIAVRRGGESRTRHPLLDGGGVAVSVVGAVLGFSDLSAGTILDNYVARQSKIRSNAGVGGIGFAQKPAGCAGAEIVFVHVLRHAVCAVEDGFCLLVPAVQGSRDCDLRDRQIYGCAVAGIGRAVVAGVNRLQKRAAGAAA